MLPRFTLATAAICAAMTSATAFGVTITESFDYTDGATIQGLNGGTGWAGGSSWNHPQWTFGAGSNVISAGSLTYSGITSSGNKAYFNLATTGAYPQRQMGTSFTDGDTFYVGFLAQKLVANDNTRWWGIGLQSGNTEKSFIGAGSGHANYEVALGSNQFLNSGVNTQNFAMILVKIELKAGVETVTMWVNPDLSSTESVASAIGGASISSNTDWGTIDTIRIGGSGPGSGQAGASNNLDELFITTDSPFAVPEPASMMILASGAALVLRRKR